MKVLYITFTDMKSNDGASALRPQKMLQAFINNKADVLLLSGEQSNTLRKERIAEIRRIRKEVKEQKPDICYIESSTNPILIKEDIELIKYIHKLRIPIGYFYRDCYRNRKYQYMVKRSGFINSLKDVYLNLLQYRTDKLLKKADIIYFPSRSMANHFNYRNSRLLPPAADMVNQIERSFDKVAIYVGGISERYGFELLLQTFDKLNSMGEYKLIIVCRKYELKLSDVEIQKRPWLEIAHVSGDALKPLYERASIALVPLLSGYNDLAISVKLYEYLSYGLPIVSTDIYEMSKIIENNGVGVVVGQTVNEYAMGIQRVLESKDKWRVMCQKASEMVKNGNTWNDRASQVVDELMEIREERKR